MIKNMEKVVERYNRIMDIICREHLTIGSNLSENTSGDPENVKNRLWTIADMVAECDYQLSTYYENGHVNEEMRRDYDPDVRKQWRREVGFLTRFIERYKDDARETECFQGHCSRFDN